MPQYTKNADKGKPFYDNNMAKRIVQKEHAIIQKQNQILEKRRDMIKVSPFSLVPPSQGKRSKS